MDGRKREGVLCLWGILYEFVIFFRYDVQQVANMADFVNLLAFDMHTERGANVADHHAPLTRRDKDRNGLDAFLNVVRIFYAFCHVAHRLDQRFKKKG